MTTYKELFGNEVCKCGKKGVHIISNGSGKVMGFQCTDCKNKGVLVKKQTAANNVFLKEVKSTYNKLIYQKILTIVNERGTDAGKQELEEIERYI